MTCVKCSYCGKDASLVTGKEIYPHRKDLYDLKFWQCPPCDAYVGCHKVGNGYGDGTRPFGRLANPELREAKQMAHLHFDKLWNGAGAMTRNAAYRWLARKLGIPFEQCHIGEFDVSLCYRTVQESKTILEVGNL